MAQLVVRNIEESVKARLKRRAQHNGRSMEEEVREILRNATNEPERRQVGLGTEIANLMRGSRLSFDAKELRGHPIKAATFGE